MNCAKGIAAVVGYIAAIYTANLLVAVYHLQPLFLIGLFGLVAPAGVYAAGICLALRNTIQDRIGRPAVFAAICTGALLSWYWSDHKVAIASGVTFLVSEFCETAVFMPVRKHGWVRAVAAGNLAGSLVDSILFLHLAGLWGWSAFFGQVIGKYVCATIIPVALVAAWRAVRARRKPQAVAA